MNPVHQVWWRLLDSGRVTLRYTGERFPKVAPAGVRLRWLTHLAVGNPLHAVVVVLWLVALRTRVTLALVVAALGLFEVWYRLAFPHGGRIVAWRAGWAFRRSFPRKWADMAAKTKQVQAEVGTSREPVASVTLRPVADHPKMSWGFRVRWPVVTWWVGPPPGRTFTTLAESTVPLAASMSNVAGIEVEFDTETDSVGRLHVSFVNVLAETRRPDWADVIPLPERPDTTNQPEPGFDAAVADLRRLHPEPDAGGDDSGVA